MKKDILIHFLTWAVVTALIYLILLYWTLYSWIDPSTGLFYINKVMFLPALPGLLMLVVEAVTHTISLHQYQQQVEREGLKPLHWFWRVSLLTVAVFVLCSGLDSLYFEYVDKGISQAYAESIAQIYANNNEVADGQLIRMFATVPFFLQNVFMNLVCILLGNLGAGFLSRSLRRTPELAA